MSESEEFLGIITEWSMEQRPSVMVGDFNNGFLKSFSAYDDAVMTYYIPFCMRWGFNV